MASFRAEPVSINVPATCANLGPGFDSLGLALNSYDRLSGVVTQDEGVLVEVEVAVVRGNHAVVRNGDAGDRAAA